MSGETLPDHTKQNSHQSPATPVVVNGNGVVFAGKYAASSRLRLTPNKDHKPDSYDDMRLDFSPLLFRSLEQYLPQTMLGVPRDAKLHYMRDILLRYSPDGERIRVSFSLSIFAIDRLLSVLWLCMREKRYCNSNKVEFGCYYVRLWLIFLELTGSKA